MRPSSRLASKSSKLWLARQFRDSYVKQRMASPAQYRSRSAFKLLEMDAKYKFLERRRPSSFSHPRIIVDLGAAPGGWSQVVALKYGYAELSKGRDPLRSSDEPLDGTHYGLKPAARIKSEGSWSDLAAEHHTLSRTHDHTSDDLSVKIIALDLIRIQPIRGVISIQADFLSPHTAELIRAHFPENTPKYGVDVILSDMAANATGNPDVDARNSLDICKAVLKFAHQHLSVKEGSEPGGVLVMKHFTHPDMQEFRKVHLHHFFRRVIYAKPPSSRPDSSEGYFICIDWLGHRPNLHVRLSELQRRKDSAKANGSDVEDSQPHKNSNIRSSTTHSG